MNIEKGIPLSPKKTRGGRGETRGWVTLALRMDPGDSVDLPSNLGPEGLIKALERIYGKQSGVTRKISSETARVWRVK